MLPPSRVRTVLVLGLVGLAVLGLMTMSIYAGENTYTHKLDFGQGVLGARMV